MTLDTVIYENIPVSYTGSGTSETTDVTIDMIADRSLPEGLYLIKLVGITFTSGTTYTNTWDSSVNYMARLSLSKGTALVNLLKPFSFQELRIDGTTTQTGTASNSLTFILTNSTAKPIKIRYLAGKVTTSGHYFNLTGTYIFQKLRDLNAGEE